MKNKEMNKKWWKRLKKMDLEMELKKMMELKLKFKS